MGLSHINYQEHYMKRTSSLLIAVLAAFALPVLAQTNTPKVDQRQVNQQQRIDQGVKSGQLTGNEAAKLEKGQAQVEKKEAKAKADGKVTPKEREKLKQAQNKQSEKIKHEKHDKQHDLNHDGKKDVPAAKK
jgi:hypothetical protein